MQDIFNSLEESGFHPTESSTIAKLALKWLNAAEGEIEEAANNIHAWLGRYLFKTRELRMVPVASAHLARGKDVNSLANVLVDAFKVIAETWLHTSELYFAFAMKAALP